MNQIKILKLLVAIRLYLSIFIDNFHTVFIAFGLAGFMILGIKILGVIMAVKFTYMCLAIFAITIIITVFKIFKCRRLEG